MVALWTHHEFDDNRFRSSDDASPSEKNTRRRIKTFEDAIKGVLKPEVAFAATVFAKDTFDNTLLFGPIGIMRGAGIIDCPHLSPDTQINGSRAAWDALVGKEVSTWDGRSGEFFQEVGFIEFLRNYYPNSFTIVSDEDAAKERGLVINGEQVINVNDLIKVPSSPRVFFPICGMMSEDITSLDTMKFGVKPIEKASNAVSVLQEHVPSKKIFYVVPHPAGQSSVGQEHPQFSWMNEIFNARALKIDQVARGTYFDILIPISAVPALSDYASNKNLLLRKDNLVYSCGRDHSVIYKGLRSNIPNLFNSLNKTGIDMVIDRTPEDYEQGFYKSKFCFIVPGDTTATSQATRAMLAGCVPIFLTRDFRDLPFSNILNYKSFSIVLRSGHFTTVDDDLNRQRAMDLYSELGEMVANGTYDEMKCNVEIVRDFFDYHRFGSRSPYGAALVSMYKDELDEYY